MSTLDTKLTVSEIEDFIIFYSAKVDITLENLEEFRRECMEHYRTDIVYFTYEEMN